MSTFIQPLGSRVDGVALYAAGLVAVAVAAALGLVAAGFGLGNTWAVVALACVALVAERGTVKLSSSSSIEESISLLPSLFAAVLFGPLAAMFVSAASMLFDLRGHPERPYLRWSVYTATRSITGAVTGLVALAVSGALPNHLAALALAAAVGAMTAECLDVGFAAVTFKVRGSGEMSEVINTLAPAVLASIPLYAPIVALLAYAFLYLSPWTLPLFFIPALAAQHLFVLYQGQRHLTDELLSANDRLERANVSFAAALVTTLDARDQYTAGHSAAVAIYAKDIATRMGLTPHECDLAHLAGLVHDVGKVGLPLGLLEKQGPLTLDERRQMEAHCEIGERILSKVESYQEIARIVRHHHECFDGTGYPDKLRGDEVPLIARIIGVADAYDAMTSDRPYRQAMPSRVARLRLAQAVESQFDTSVVAAFEAILAGADEGYRMGQRPEFGRATEELIRRAGDFRIPLASVG